MTNTEYPAVALASRDSSGASGNGQSGGISTATSLSLGGPTLSSNGDVTFFSSEANNLSFISDANGLADVFFSGGKGQFVMAISGSLGGGTCSGQSTLPIVGGDGAYYMYRTTCASPSPWTQAGCVLQHSQTGTLYSLSTQPTCVPYDVSSDGRYALFTEPVSGVTTLKRYDRTSSQFLTAESRGTPTSAGMSSDGRYVVFLSTFALAADDTNGVADLYLTDLSGSNPYIRVSTKSDGTQLPNGASAGGISGDGSYVWFVTRDAAVSTDTDGEADLYFAQRGTASSTTLASRMTTSGAVGLGDVSNDGQYYVFEFTPSGGNKEVWVYDRVTQTNKSAHKTYNGGVPNGSTELPSISGDGRFIAYVGWGTNMVASDTNGKADVFLRLRP